MVELDFGIAAVLPPEGERKICPAALSTILPMTKQPAPRRARDCRNLSSRSAGTAMSNPPEVCASNPRFDRCLVHARRNVNRPADILAVALNRARNDALPQGVHRAVEGGQRLRRKFPRRAAPGRSIRSRCAKRPKPVTSVQADAPASFIASAAAWLSAVMENSAAAHAGRIIAPDLAAKRQHPGAERLGQDQRVAGLGFVQRGGHGGIDQAGDGEAEFNFLILDAVPADEGDAGLA